jgi:DNA-binding SARP family transcriptional activator
MATDSAEPTAALDIRLLGPLDVSSDGRPVPLPTGRLPALLAVLAMSAGQTVSAERLAIAVWGEDLAVDARANVQTNVKRLRRLIGADRIATRGHGYALDVDPDRVDALRFERLIEAVAAADRPELQRELLDDALRLWRGAPFEDIASDWLAQAPAARLQERYLAAIERRTDLDLADESRTDVADLAAALDDQTRRHPLRESLWLRLLLVLQRAGRSAEALERYETMRRGLAEELGTDPGPDLQRVHADLLAGRQPQPPAAAPLVTTRVVPRQLPADTGAFSGRDTELAALDRMLGDGADSHASGIAAITGTAGVGKTTLAVHWAHRIADRFPDGQLYVNLRGFDPSRPPVPPAEALRGILDALQVPPQQIPSGLDAQAGLYRSLLAGQRMLVVLDNAADADQVTPLLPGASGCLAIVTSRSRLTGLLAAGAQAVALDVLDRAEAAKLLVRRLGADRVAAEPEAADQIVASCAGLPLALAVVGARAAARPDFPLATLAGQLREARNDLEEFDGGDCATDVRAVFSWSYRSLTEPAARLFRLLGLHPGPDVTVGAAASLAGQPVADVRPLLAGLADAHLVSEYIPGRYSFHDLLRAYAAELTATLDEPDVRDAAMRRMLDHYLRTAHQADRLLYPHGEAASPATAESGVAVEDLRDGDQAMAWLTAEHRVLLGVVDQAGRDGFDRHVCHLARATSVFFHRRGHWEDRATVHSAALAAAHRLGDRAEEARAHRNLATVYADLARFDDAQDHFGQALELAEAAGDTLGQAQVHYERNLAYTTQGRNAEALAAAEEALRRFQDVGNQVGEAAALTDVGWGHGRLGDHRQALELLGRALALHEELGNHAYQGHALSCMAESHEQLGELDQAIADSRRAEQLFDRIGDRYGVASTLARLGELYQRVDDPVAAAAARDEARPIIDELDPSAAAQIRGQLHRLEKQSAATE